MWKQVVELHLEKSTEQGTVSTSRNHKTSTTTSTRLGTSFRDMVQRITRQGCRHLSRCADITPLDKAANFRSSRRKLSLHFPKISLEKEVHNFVFRFVLSAIIMQSKRNGKKKIRRRKKTIKFYLFISDYRRKTCFVFLFIKNISAVHYDRIFPSQFMHKMMRKKSNFPVTTSDSCPKLS